ncbi:MAG: thioredoxin reductase [Thermodesulfobacterium geofontis]|uniref:Thioredoxin reductase n=1 Tax=Thermodesulfobacterium geofontis TaxID=1295609 RepID=A0A2N7PPI9_9BACT|nr:MAG: thioredoxin reductase [Thermodesulfobacterium geofontis]PMP97901.1 MAG: thioredoxin reductase [Thermodesulfobacterium geofontis]
MTYDIAIIGLGPAGIQAGIHAGRRKNKVIVFGKKEESALNYAHLENYFGFKEKIEGKELLEAGIEQLKRAGVDILEEDIIKIEPLERGFKLITEKEKEFIALALVLAMGVKRKKSFFKREKDFVGKGVSYCVDCDAWFYKGKKTLIIGDGSSAIWGAKFLTQFAEEVYFYFSKGEIPSEEKEALIQKGVKILASKPIEILGEREVEGIKLEDESIIKVDGIFIEQGARGPLELLAPLGIELDLETFSYVKVDKKMKTNVEGIFACGDITGPPLQVAKAVGEGCIAGLSASDYVSKIKKEI